MPDATWRRPETPIAALLAGILALAACADGQGGLVLVGTVERTLVEVAAPVSETLLRVPVERGQRVEAGTLLAELDPTLARAEVARAEAALAGARTARLIAQSDLDRLSNLRRSRVASQYDWERAQLGRDEAEARLREAEAMLAAARKRLADLRLTVPVAGVVDQIPFDRGERVPAGGVVVVLLQDGDPWVRIWVPEERVAGIGPGTPARVAIDGVATALDGSVLDVSREPEFTPHYALTERDRVHLVYETRVRIHDAPETLRAGMPAEVRFDDVGVEPAS